MLYGESPPQADQPIDEPEPETGRKLPVWVWIITAIALILGISGIWIMTRSPAPPSDPTLPPTETTP